MNIKILHTYIYGSSRDLESGTRWGGNTGACDWDDSDRERDRDNEMTADRWDKENIARGLFRRTAERRDA